MAVSATKMKRRRRGATRTTGTRRVTDAAGRQALIVLGMHRSGTSALTRVFSLLGADLPRNVMGPGRGNDVGHWESTDLVVVHDEMLASAGSRWDDWRAFNPDWAASGVAETFRARLLAVMQADFQNSPLFLLKDPRICRFMPVWREVLTRFGAVPHVAIPIRNPVEVAASLKARDGFLPAKSYLLWLRHVLDAERSTRDLPRAITTYNALMDDWRHVARDIGGRLGVRWPRWSDAAALEIDRFMSASLRHHAVDTARLTVRADIVDWVKAAYDALTAIAGQGENARSRATLDRIAAEFDRASFAFGLALAEENGRAEEARQEAQRLTHEIEMVRGDAAAEVTHAREELQRVATEAAKARAEVEHAAADASSARDEVARITAEATRLHEEAGVQAVRLDELSNAHAAGLEEAARLGRELASARDDTTRLARELDGARAFLRDSQTEVQRLAGDLAQAEAGIAAAASERDAARAAGDVLAAELHAERMVTDQVRAEAARLVSEVVDVREALSEAVRARDAARDERNGLAVALDVECAANGHLRHEIDALKAALQEQNAARESEHARAEHLAAELSRRDAALTEVARERDTARDERDGFAADLAAEHVVSVQARRESERLAADLRAEKAAAALLRTETERLTADLQSEKAAAQHAQTEVTGLSVDLAAARRDTATAGRELTATRALIADLRGTLDQQARLVVDGTSLNGAGGGWPEKMRRLFSPLARARAARQAEHAAITRARLFDALWYLERYLDVAAAGDDPLWHYLLHGAAEGRDPHPLFDGRWYAGQAGDLAGSGLSPLGHYVMQGAAAGLDPHPLFDTDWYLAQNPDVAAARINPLYHFWKIGAAVGRDPHPLFDTSWYLEQNPDVARAGDNALYHYLMHGWKEGRDPHPEFDETSHSKIEGDLIGINPLLQRIYRAHDRHYPPREMRTGGESNRSLIYSKSHTPQSVSANLALFEPDFDSEGYLICNPDVGRIGETSKADAFGHWVSYGFAEGRLAPGLKPFKSRRCNTIHTDYRLPGVDYFGFLDESTGLGVAARSYVSALRRAGLSVSEFAVGKTLTTVTSRSASSRRHPAQIFHLNADHLMRFFLGDGAQYLNDAYNIGIWAWELASFRPDWALSYGALDEVWVPSEFCRQAIDAISPIPVVRIPHAVTLDLTRRPLPRSHFGIPDNCFVFAAIFDVGSQLIRKNPEALVRAFKSSFMRSKEVMLVLKYYNSSLAPFQEDVEALLRLADQDNIMLIDQVFDERELASFKQSIDCFVSPHRSEGFGLNVAEAMLLGKPVIATGYSGNMDYMTAENSYPIDYHLAEIEKWHGPYPKGYIWAEPSFDHLCSLLIKVFEHQDEARATGVRAAAAIAKSYSLEAVGATMAKRLRRNGILDG